MFVGGHRIGVTAEIRKSLSKLREHLVGERGIEKERRRRRMMKIKK